MGTLSETDRHSSHLYTRNFLLLWIANFFITACLGCFFLLPLYIKDHGGSESDIGILMGAVTISSILGRPWIARAVDGFGRKKSFLLGTSSFFFVPFAFLLFDGNISDIYVPFLALRIFQGVGIALCFTSVFTLIADIIPSERLNEGLGMFGVTGLIGVATGPAISEPIIRNFGFNAYFITISMMALCSLLLQLPVPDTYIPEKRLDDGISFLAVLKMKKIFGMGLLTTFFGIAMATQNSFVSPFAQELGLPNISVFFIAYSFAAVLARIFGSKLADRIGEIKVIPGALTVTAVGFLSLVLVDNSTLLIIAGFITGLGHGFLFPCLNALMIRNEPVRIRGKINGVFTGSIDLGLFIGSIGLGYIGEWFGYKPIFVATFISLMMGLVLFMGYIRGVIR